MDGSLQRKSRWMWVLISLALLSLPKATSAEMIASYSSGIWQGGAETNDDGEILHCFLGATSENKGYKIWFRWDDAGLHLTLYDKNWSLNDGETFQARVKIDRRFNQDVAGKFLNPQSVDFIFGFDKSALSAVRKGNSITLESPQEEYQFNLRGTSKAIKVLQKCALAQNFPLEQPKQRVTAARPTVTGDYKDGADAYRAKDYRTALQIWLPLARKEDFKAQYGLGVLYYTGNGVPKDHTLAVGWYRKSALLGYAPAQNTIGIMYRDGIGAGQDYSEAARWFREAAEQDHEKAQANLEAMYASNLLVKPSLTFAGSFLGKISGTVTGDNNDSETNLKAVLKLRINGETVTGHLNGELLLASVAQPEKIRGRLEGSFDPDTGKIALVLRAIGSETSIRVDLSGVRLSGGFSGEWQGSQGLQGNWLVSDQELKVSGVSTQMCATHPDKWKTLGGECN